MNVQELEWDEILHPPHSLELSPFTTTSSRIWVTFCTKSFLHVKLSDDAIKQAFQDVIDSRLPGFCTLQLNKTLVFMKQ